MLGITADPGEFEHHYLPLEEIQESTVPVTLNMNRYLLRSVDMDIACNPRSAFVYAKMCRLLVVGFIKTPDTSEWVGTRVDYDKGTIQPRHYHVPGLFGQYLMDRAKKMQALQDSISDKQKNKIGEAIATNPDKVANSESFRAMECDVRLFGRSAFSDYKDAE